MRALCAVALLLNASCGGSSPSAPLDFDFSSATCDRATPQGYLLGVTAGFTLAQLTELMHPSATYVAVLRVGESTSLEVTARTLGTENCSDRTTAVSWATSDSGVATVHATGRATALLTARTPGEITIQAQASFPGAAIEVPYIFASAGPRIRAVRVVP